MKRWMDRWAARQVGRNGEPGCWQQGSIMAAQQALEAEGQTFKPVKTTMRLG